MDNPNKKLNLKMILCSAVILLLLFGINIFLVVNASNNKQKDSEMEQETIEEVREETVIEEKTEEIVEEAVSEEKVVEKVQIGAECLKKHRGEIYRTEDGKHFFYADSMNFYPACNEHFITHDINEASYSGLLLCFEGDVDVRNFIYYIEDGKECFVSEEEKFKFVYDEALGKWSTYSNAENITSSEGYAAGEWVPLYEYYSEEVYEEVYEAFVQNQKEEEEREYNEKLNAMKNTNLQLQAGENTVTIHAQEGFIPYSNVTENEIRYVESKNGEDVVVLGRASSYEELMNDEYEELTWKLSNGEDYLTEYNQKILNFRYSIKDSIDDLVPGHKDHVYVYETEKEVILDSAGNEIVVLDVIMMSPFYAEAGYYHQKEQLVEVYDYSLANGCSAQEAYNALGYEGEFYMPILNFEDVQREYYKKLENGKYLCLTVEYFYEYQHAYLWYKESDFELTEEYQELLGIYGGINKSEIIGQYMSTLKISHDDFLPYLENGCYTYE